MIKSLIPLSKIKDLVDRMEMVLYLNGDVAEAGVYRGGSAERMAEKMYGGKTLHLFDTFAGMPETNKDLDKHRKNDFNDVTLEKVKEDMKRFSFITFHEGLFSDTLKEVEEKKFCFIHVDCDLYSSVKECCEFFYPRLSTGGIMVFDDYGSPTCPGAKKAVDEFVSTIDGRYFFEKRHGSYVIVKFKMSYD
ncbi:MAG: TylF/MycF/NovP-related O-methyltransferase [Candidatus Shapirobacteria bacterium]|jgi:O-methyltransferase